MITDLRARLDDAITAARENALLLGRRHYERVMAEEQLPDALDRYGDLRDVHARWQQHEREMKHGRGDMCMWCRAIEGDVRQLLGKENI